MSQRRSRILLGDDDATGQLDERLDVTVRVEFADSEPAWRHQVLAIALVDLLGRLLPRIEVSCDSGVNAHRSLPPGPALLVDRLEEARQHGGPADDLSEPRTVVRIGPGGSADLHVDGSGWNTYLGTSPGEPFDDNETNPVGPLVAACHAAAKAVTLLLAGLSEDHPPAPARYWSAFTYAGSTQPLPPGPPLVEPALHALLMGGGSIGGAAAYLFARTPDLRGDLLVLDPQDLDDRNVDKAILARPADVTSARAKVEVIEEELAHHAALEVDAQPMPLAGWVAGRARENPLRLVLCAVDSISSRRELQDHLPLEVINAACGSKDVAISGHRTDDGPCVYCLHLETVLDRDFALVNILHRETGILPALIGELLAKRAPLTALHLLQIERHRKVSRGSFARYEGQTLDELYREQILYGEERIGLGDGQEAAIAAPYATALAGFLLAAEALKACGTRAWRQSRLGPDGELGAIKYEESLAHAAATGMVSSPPRWPDAQCLCRDDRRLQLMRQRYGLT